MTWHLVDYERGAPRSGTDFGVTLGGVVYSDGSGPTWSRCAPCPTVCGGCLISLPAVWIGDSAAYFVGRAIGRHRMAPRLSPKKSWEGYLAGVVGAAPAGAGLAPPCGRGGQPSRRR